MVAPPFVMWNIRLNILVHSAALSADFPVDLDANPPLTENDLQLGNWILGLFETIKPNDEH